MAIKQINVTQLKYACLDAEWREQWLRGENPPTRFFAPTGISPAYGTLFHKLAEDYTGWLVTSEKAATLADADSLWHEQ